VTQVASLFAIVAIFQALGRASSGGVHAFGTRRARERSNLLTMAVEIVPGVTTDPQIAFGKPVIAGTRVPVALVLGQLAGGARGTR
jgi:hypothetical protein